VFYVAALGLLALDVLTKIAVRTHLPVSSSVPVINGVLHLTHVQNTGAVFGLLPDRRVLFVVVALAATAALVMLNHQLRPRTTLLQVALGLQLGGTLGNLVDRAASGRVTDFLDFRVWPVFNLADSGIVVGGVLLAWWLLRGGAGR